MSSGMPEPSSSMMMVRRSPSREVATKMPVRTGVAGVAQHLDDDVLDAADVVLCLATLGLGDAQAHEAPAEVLLDAKGLRRRPCERRRS